MAIIIPNKNKHGDTPSIYPFIFASYEDFTGLFPFGGVLSLQSRDTSLKRRQEPHTEPITARLRVTA